jgi:Na+/phosphate symporter
MKNKDVFFNPFRLISPKLDAEASRLDELQGSPPEEVTCLEEGLLIMTNKLIEMTGLLRKSLIIAEPAKLDLCARLGQEIHDEEKGLTGDIVCSPTETTGDVLKTVVLFPGRLERVGDLLESILNVSRIKARDGVPFSDKANKELDKLFGLLTEVLTNFRDALLTRNKALLEAIVEDEHRLGKMIVDFRLAHEDRLLEGLCSPKASSLYLDVSDSIRDANRHLKEMSESLLQLTAAQARAEAT